MNKFINCSYFYGSDGGRNRGGRGHDGLVGTTVKVRQGAYKGYRGRVVEVKGPNVRVELESQMKVVTGKSTCWVSCPLGYLCILWAITLLSCLQLIVIVFLIMWLLQHHIGNYKFHFSSFSSWFLAY